MKRGLIVSLFVLFLISPRPLPVSATDSRSVKKVPRSGTVILHLLKTPGLKLPDSKWEVAYELRMLPESRLFEERAKLNDRSTEHAGDLIKKGALAKLLDSLTGQTMLLQIPFNADTLDKLKNQPADRLAPGQDTKSQAFVFYSIISVHDAKLKKTLAIPVCRTWDFANFPEARFEINIEISDDERVDVRSSSLKTRGITRPGRTK